MGAVTRVAAAIAAFLPMSNAWPPSVALAASAIQIRFTRRLRKNHHGINTSDTTIKSRALHFIKQKPQGHCPGAFVRIRTLKWDYAAISFRFLRQPSTPKPASPVAKSGRAAGSGTFEVAIVAIANGCVSVPLTAVCPAESSRSIVLIFEKNTRWEPPPVLVIFV